MEWPDGHRVVVVEQPARGEAELLPHQVDARDLLGDRVLDLQARVHLEERDRPVGADEELARARTGIADLAEDRLRRFVEEAVLLLGEEGRGGLFDELLVPALQRAVAGGDHDDVARGIRQALRLDVPGLVEVLLDEALAAPEGADRLSCRGVEHLGDLVELAGHLESAPAAAVRGLDGDRQAELLGERDDLVGAGDGARGARRQRRAHLLGDVARGDLVAECLDRLGRRPDPDQPRVDDGARERRRSRRGSRSRGARRPRRTGGRRRGSCRSAGRCRRSSSRRGRTTRPRVGHAGRRDPGRRRRRRRRCPSRGRRG